MTARIGFLGDATAIAAALWLCGAALHLAVRSGRDDPSPRIDVPVPLLGLGVLQVYAWDWLSAGSSGLEDGLPWLWVGAAIAAVVVLLVRRRALPGARPG